MSETRVLFNWKPRTLDMSLDTRLRQRLLRAEWYTHPLTVLLRTPNVNTAVFDEVTRWHQDDAGGRDIKFIVWSNVRPTEVRFPDGTFLQAQDGDVILIDNKEVEHRAPEDQTGRWFVRTGLVVGPDPQP